MASDQKKRATFTGDGFSQDEFSEKERAEIRERGYHFDRHFMSVEDFLKETGLTWVSTAAKGFPAYLKVFATISAIGGGILVLRSMGILQ